MKHKLFIDSDVIIDFFTDREPFVNASSELFDLSEKKEVLLFISALSVNNIYYLVRKYLGHLRAISVIEELLRMTEIVGTTKTEIMQALKNDFNDFEDSVQYSSALSVKGLDAIITRNVKDYRNSSLAVMTPTIYLASRKSKLI